jgi:hypothetical protein
MKINEIPEKIHLSYETDDEDYKDHIFIDYMWHRHPFEDKYLTNVEYTRTDTLIEKAIKYVANHFLAPGMDNEINDFVNYMKANETIDFFSVHSREEVAEIDKRIERKQKEYDAELRDRIMKAKDFLMTD